jgi:glutamate dehydrogenase/leucine dehydrogenase
MAETLTPRLARSASAGTKSVTFLGISNRLQNAFTGLLTGKGIAFGGSLIRLEAI